MLSSILFLLIGLEIKASVLYWIVLAIYFSFSLVILVKKIEEM